MLVATAMLALLASGGALAAGCGRVGYTAHDPGTHDATPARERARTVIELTGGCVYGATQAELLRALAAGFATCAASG